LLLQCLREVSGALTQFVQQPRILDGDNGLSGEVRGQCDLPFGEGTNFLTDNRDNSNKLLIFEHWHPCDCTNATKLDCFDRSGMTLKIRFCRRQIGDLNSPFGSYCFIKHSSRSQLERPPASRFDKRRSLLRSHEP
jgi:hypothetical protein